MNIRLKQDSATSAMGKATLLTGSATKQRADNAKAKAKCRAN